MKVYVVIKEGVYRHEIKGIYNNIESAVKGAEQSALKEKDSYHSFEIGFSELNENVEDVEIFASVSIEFFTLDYTVRPLNKIAATKTVHDKPVIKVKFYE